MSIETYERRLALIDVYKKLFEAEQEITNGEPLLDGENVFRGLREKHGRK